MPLRRRLFGHCPQPRGHRRRSLVQASLSLESLEQRALLAGDLVFGHGFGASASDKGNAVIADAQGNVYMTGQFKNTVDFDPGPGVNNLVGVATDTYITKYSAAGDLLWAKSLDSTGTNSFNTGQDLTIDSSGNLWVMGSFYGATDFDPGPDQAILTPRSASEDYLLKLDSNGNYLSVGAFQGGGFFGGVAADTNGNLYLTGQFSGTADLDPGPGDSLFTSSGMDAFVSKVGSDGNLIWAKHFGGAVTTGNGDCGYDIAVDVAGNAFVTGVFDGSVDFDPGAGTTIKTSTGSNAVFTSKFDANGSFLWVAVFDSAGTEPQDIAVDSAGNVISTGGFQSTVDFDPGGGIHTLTAPTAYFGAYVAKLDTSGAYVWAKKLCPASGGQGYGYGISIGPNDDIFTTGQFSGDCDFDPGSGNFIISGAGSIDAYMSRLASDGTFVTAGALGGTALDRGLAIAFSSAQGEVYVTGLFNGTADLDPGPLTDLHTSAGSDDIFLAGLDTDNTAPYFTSPAAFNIAENTTAVATLSAYDAEFQAVTYSIGGGADAALFSIDPSTGALTFKSAPDFEDPGHGPTYLVDVAASDGTLIGTQSLTITVTNVNEAPTLIELSDNVVDENQPAGTVVGSFTTTDPDVGDTFAYSLVTGTGDEGNGSFTIVGNQLQTNAVFDASSQSYSIRVQSQDAGGLPVEQNFTITINHLPTAILLPGSSIAENQPAGTAVGTFDTTDQDAGDSFTYTFVVGAGDADNSSFTISGNTLQTAASFNFEAQNSYSIRVRSTDSGNAWVEQTFVISVTDVNDLPSGGVAITGVASEDVVLSADVSGLADQDGLGTLHYQWQRSTDGFATSTNVGSDSNSYTLGDADVGTHLRVVVSYVDGHGTSESVTSASVGPVANVNDAPVLNTALNPTLPTIQEDTRFPAGTQVASLLAGAVTDADAGALRGIAVTAASETFGHWQYTLNGTTWSPMNSPSPAAALLLPGYARVAFTPKPDFNGVVKLWYNAWDQTQGTVGGTLPIAGNTGGTKSLSTANESASLTVTPVNDAPVMTIANPPALTSIQEDNRNSYGTPVGNLITGVTDADAGAKHGIAVTFLPDTAKGNWQYTLDAGATWHDFGSPSLGSARLLPADGTNSRVRFQPNTNFNGTVKMGYYAWDQTQGTTGSTFDISASITHGGIAAFSIAYRTSNLTVTPINDAPVLTLSGTIGYVHNRPPVVLAAAANVTDVDSGDFSGGRLRVRIGTGANATNVLAIGAGFTLDSNNNVLQGTTIIGKRTFDGVGTHDLIIVFTSAATPTVARDLVRSITFRTGVVIAGVKPTVIFTVSDGDGGTSAEQTKTVSVT
jgi:hypothetical protein